MAKLTELPIVLCVIFSFRVGETIPLLVKV